MQNNSIIMAAILATLGGGSSFGQVPAVPSTAQAIQAAQAAAQGAAQGALPGAAQAAGPAAGLAPGLPPPAAPLAAPAAVAGPAVAPAAATAPATAATAAGSAAPASVAGTATQASAKSFPSVWDVLGVGQFFGFMSKWHQKCVDTRPVRVARRAKLRATLETIPVTNFAKQTLAPFCQMSGLKPGTATDAFGAASLPGAAGAGGVAPPPGPEEIAAKIADQQDPAKVQVKIKAIRFLAQQDCICYPEVIDALLTALDDCSEEVRYEAMKALRFSCTRGNCAACGNQRHCLGDPSEGQACGCQEKVIKRFSDLLLDRDARGRLKERSARIRSLAQLSLSECLESTPVGQPEKSGAEPDPTPKAKIDAKTVN